MNRKIYYWKLRDAEMQLGERTLIMGVLNITPDSFSDGGRFNDPDRALSRALELEEQGADIIDIGAESTKPGSQRISADEEWQRLVPVLKRLRDNLRAPLSLDTYKSEIAERALQYGVQIFNDPSGLTFDPNLAKVAANGNAGLILNHMRGQPETWGKLPPMQDAIGTVMKDLDATVSRARHAGVERARIVVDPGLGFGKRKEQNAEILAHLRQLAELDYPILVGPSRKSFLAQASENDTLFATAAAVTACVLNGAHILRVHDVREMHAAIQVAEEIARAAAPRAGQEEEKAATRSARTHASPDVVADRPRPTRPPLAKPPVEQPAVAAEPQREQAGQEPPRQEPRPARAPYPDRDRDRRDGSAPPRRDFRPGRNAGDDKARFRPAAGARPFDRDRDRGRDNDRRDARPPRAPYPDRDREQSRPPYSKPPFRDRSEPSGPPRREFRPAAGRSGPPRSGPPRDDRFKPSGPPRSGPPRSFDRGPDRRDDWRENRPPRGAAPSGPGDRPGGGRPPNRPFRKRP